MRTLGLGERFKASGDLVEPFFARGARHAGIHIGIFMGLAGDGGREVLLGGADRLAGRRIAYFFQKFQMSMRVTGLTLGRRAEHPGTTLIAPHLGLAW